jgi:hypothetical protein
MQASKETEDLIRASLISILLKNIKEETPKSHLEFSQLVQTRNDKFFELVQLYYTALFVASIQKFEDPEREALRAFLERLATLGLTALNLKPSIEALEAAFACQA